MPVCTQSGLPSPLTLTLTMTFASHMATGAQVDPQALLKQLSGKDLINSGTLGMKTDTLFSTTNNKPGYWRWQGLTASFAGRSTK